MKKLFTSTILTLAAVPFLMAAPAAAKKTQNQPAASSQTKVAVTKKAHKKHVAKKSPVKATAETPAAAATK